ncbi:DUF2911 domain-containing protein [Maribacter sp. 2-571]|uniref:DUF2911 domain-containing protein n=1 Tax=Maribacter sp. 2-571 TaxID=3417569 RepID=UPI003D32FD6A
MKFLKWFFIGIMAMGLLGYFVGYPYMKEKTKKHSPQQTTSYKGDGVQLAVTYSSPSKKGRAIFGNLVPYGAVWRTGANEPTTFSTNTDIQIADQKLAKGTYSLWTIPTEEKWTIIFNREVPDWGVTFLSGGTETTRNSEKDALRCEIMPEATKKMVERFTIEFEESPQLAMILSWEETRVRIPFNIVR